eukprot:scaffold102766_cov18-Tisochrysis_lutea.AAC.1
MQLSSTLCDSSAPAQVSERHNLGWIIKYHLKFDDEVVGGFHYRALAHLLLDTFGGAILPHPGAYPA